MTAPLIVTNRPAAQCLLYFSTNAVVNVATVNSTVDSDLTTTGTANDNQLIVGGTITKMAWSTDGSIIIKRGSNTVYTLSGSAHWDLRAQTIVNPLYPAATLVVNCTSANATLYVEVTKSTAGGNPNIGDH